jgi:2-polyprenyl-3-methyl-5-hydroxy-6-metoxy-1,4-benzoquinol methylase
MKINDVLYEQYRTIAFERAAGTSLDSPELDREFSCNLGKLIPESKTAAILDIGCGMGHFLAYLEKRGYTNCTGIDVSAEQVQCCQEHLKSKVYQAGDIVEFLRNHAGWDCVILKDVIEHLKRDGVIPILSTICESLNTRGTLLIETGNLASFTGPYLRYIDFTHESGFTENSLKQVLRAAGFAGIEVLPSSLPVFSWKSRILAFARRLLEQTLKLIYRVERGWDAIPKVYSKLLLARATK